MTGGRADARGPRSRREPAALPSAHLEVWVSTNVTCRSDRVDPTTSRTEQRPMSFSCAKMLRYHPRDSFHQDPMPRDLDRLQGAWSITFLEMDGEEMVLPDFGDARVTLANDRFRSTGM